MLHEFTELLRLSQWNSHWHWSCVTPPVITEPLRKPPIKQLTMVHKCYWASERNIHHRYLLYICQVQNQNLPWFITSNQIVIITLYTDWVCKSSRKLKNNLSSGWILDPGLLRVPELAGTMECRCIRQFHWNWAWDAKVPSFIVWLIPASPDFWSIHNEGSFSISMPNIQLLHDLSCLKRPDPNPR